MIISEQANRKISKNEPENLEMDYSKVVADSSKI